MPVADCPLCCRDRIPLRQNGSFRSHPGRVGGMAAVACPSTGRKPLVWYEGVPDCIQCRRWLYRPWMAEAVASVGIETGGVDVPRMVGAYHLNRRREDQ